MALEQLQQRQAESYAQVVAKAWEDDAYKQVLVADPLTVLKAHGVPLPAGKAVRMVEDTAETLHVILPTKPAGELSDEQLARRAAQAQGRARTVGQLLIKAWEDPAFKQRLVADPRRVLQEHGLPLPPGKAVRVVEDSADTVHLILPLKPAEGELSDEQLEHVAGGIAPILVGIGVAVGVEAVAFQVSAAVDYWFGD
jgi:hypothetical protein